MCSQYNIVKLKNKIKKNNKKSSTFRKLKKKKKKDKTTEWLRRSANLVDYFQK